ncbi:hypothetical protein [Streptococcus sp. oral taxon 431]|uniref:hypothetical protein n=1 Tax=Streptococcus TaxID=1301 RepID=UPI002004725A|nr:hypothetical protein [Streptococcus sp. oral taxon 431]
MNYDDVKEKLCNIIIKYIDHPDIRLQMLEQAKSVNTVRGVLYSLDTEKNRDLTQEEIDFCKDLFFYFG